MNSISRRLKVLQLPDVHISDDMNFNCSTCSHWGIEDISTANNLHNMSGVCYGVNGLIQDGQEYWPITSILETCGKWKEKSNE